MKTTINGFLCPLSVAFLLATAGTATAQAPPVTVDPIGTSQIPRTQPGTGLEGGIREPALGPFGANLFRGRFTVEREDGINPDYILQQGDRITVRTWGAITVNESVIVDPQGNIFIPNVGPVHVLGVQNATLNSHIEQAIRRVYRENVSVYTNLEAVTPVSAFVTGFVNNPGSYAGLASDSLLYFLDRAGGIDPERGSFRDIRILRGGKVLEEVDLYDFLISGQISHRQFTDGDTILVGRRGASITVMGAARNTFSFEIPGEGMTGSMVIDLARPRADAFYATFTGTRNDLPFSSYLPLNEMAERTIKDGDQIFFEVDQVHDTMLIRVAGSHLGQSRFAVPQNTRLLEILDHIKVDPQLADIDAISIRRVSIKERQKKAIEESLVRLETAILSKHSVTAEGAAIQVKEAELIGDFVQRARQIEPQGVLVVAHNGGISDILLQPDDVILIPEKSNIVQVSGEVIVPQALVYIEGATLTDYIDRVGGYTARADESKHLVLRRNAEVVPLLNGRTDIVIVPGDEIIALPAIPSNTVEIVQLITETMFRIAGAAAIFIGVN